MNKEEILKKHTIEDMPNVAIYKAMDTYAEQVAKERERETSKAFDEWCCIRGWKMSVIDLLYYQVLRPTHKAQHSELYQLFLNDINK